MARRQDDPTTDDESTTTDANTAETPDEANDLLSTVSPGDTLRFGGETHKITETTTNDDGVPFVTCRQVSGYSPGTRTIYPSSGFRGSAVVTQSRTMGTHYNQITVLDSDDE